jgi:hypothetical protein
MIATVKTQNQKKANEMQARDLLPYDHICGQSLLASEVCSG